MTWWEAIFLGLLQGLTEFLPVSSSGHLVLGQHFLGIDEPGISFEVFVHFGTVLSVVTVYWRRIVELLGAFFGALVRPRRMREALWPGSIEGRAPEGPLRLALFVLLTIIPTGIVYVLAGDWIEAQFADARFVCAMLIVTGVLLLLIRFRPDPRGVLSPGKALLVGLAQGAAMIPGISRSGSTIATAIHLDVDRREAADFSFLMSLPVIVGATLLDLLKMLEKGEAVNWVPLLVGALVAYVVGIGAIHLVLDFVRRGRLQYFAYYLFAAGLLGLLFISP